jgi:hypothetical protein
MACAFSSAGVTASFSGSGSVPPDGPDRLKSLLARLGGRQIVVHGVGQHTLQLASVYASCPARIVAFADDDRRHHRSSLWNWPIIAPGSASASGATDVVISSWMHQDAIWNRRGIYESQGLRVHRIYA